MKVTVAENIAGAELSCVAMMLLYWTWAGQPGVTGEGRTFTIIMITNGFYCRPRVASGRVSPTGGLWQKEGIVEIYEPLSPGLPRAKLNAAKYE